MLLILYQDAYFVAINKPHGLLVHRSPLARDATEFALQKLRDQINQPVWPVHRLDRKTSGVLLFCLQKDLIKSVQYWMETRQFKKKYLALVRGNPPESGCIDNPITDENGKEHRAVTNFRVLSRGKMPDSDIKDSTRQYTLVEVSPETGRMHQIRRHLKHLRYPIIGDRPYGCNKQNRYFKQHHQMTHMMLHAASLSLPHPVLPVQLTLTASVQPAFRQMLDLIRWDQDLQTI